MKTLYAILWGQCSKALKHRIQATKGYAAMHEDDDSLSLLKELCKQAFNFQSQKDQVQALQEAIWRLNTLSQDRYTSNKLYIDRFTNSRDVIKHIDGGLPIYPALMDVTLKNKDLDRSSATPEQIMAAETESTD